LREIAAATGVSTFSARNALARVASRGPAAAAGVTAADSAVRDSGDGDADAGALVPVLPDPVPRDAERVLARWGLLGEGAVPVFTPGTRYPLAGLLLALPALEATGLLDAAREIYGWLRDGFFGLTADRLKVGALWQDHGLVFASSIGTPLDRHNVLREFRKVTKAAGLGTDWVPRELRRTFVFLLSSDGMPLEDIADLVGHKGTITTETVYRKVIVPELRRGAEVMDRLFS
jgi:hypothetical protein